MKSKGSERAGTMPVRHLSIIFGAVAALAAAPISFAAPAEARSAIPRDQGVEDFYDSRSGQLLWFKPGNGPAAPSPIQDTST